MKKALLRILALALAVAPVCSCSVFAGDEVSRARLGSLHRNDMVVVDVRRGVDTNDVMEAIGTYDRDVIQPREAAIRIPVTSVNTRTGDVVLTVKEISGAVDADTVQGMIDRIPPPPVTSVNGRTGVVSLGVREIPGAVDTTAVQAAIAAYDNDVVVPREGKIVSGGYAFPVTSVNSKTGAVVLAVGDISGAACESRTVVVTNYVEGSTSGDGNAVEGVDYSVVTNVYHVVYGDDIARLKAESEAYADGAVRDLYGDTIYPSLTSLASAATANHRFLHTLSSNNYVSAYRANERAWQLEAWQYTNSVTRTDFEAGFTDWAVTPIWAVGRLTVAQISGGTDAGKWSLFRPQTNEYSSLTALVTPVAASNDATEIQWPNSEFTYVDHGTNRTVVIDVVARRIRLSPDFSAGNAELVATIEAKAPAPADYGTVRSNAETAVQPGQLTTINAHVSDDAIHVTLAQKSLWSSKQDALTFDDAPTANSANPVKSGGVKTAIDAVAANLSAHAGSTSNPHCVTAAQVGLGNVADTGDSDTPVSGGTTKFTTGGAYTELAKKADKSDTAAMANRIASLESGKADSDRLATVATSGRYSDLKGRPELSAVATSGAYSDLTGAPALATVATSGSYNDLTGKPTIPAPVTVDSEPSMTSTNPVQNKAVTAAVNAKCTVAEAVAEVTRIGQNAVYTVTFDPYDDGETTVEFPSFVISDIEWGRTDDDILTFSCKVGGKRVRVSSEPYEEYVNVPLGGIIYATAAYGQAPGAWEYVDVNLGILTEHVAISYVDGQNAHGLARLVDLPTKTSDFTNDGSDGGHPFISQHQQLMPVYSQTPTYGWVCEPATYNGQPIEIVADPYSANQYIPYVNGEQNGSSQPLASGENTITWPAGVEWADNDNDLVATRVRTDIIGYTLGTQTAKPLQPQGDYAVKSEMSVTHGTGADADKATIQLKAGTSATVLTTHQDISDLVRITDLATVTNGIGPVRVGADTNVAKDVSVSIGFGAYSSAVEQTHATHNGWKRGIAIGQDAIASAAGVSIGPRAGMSSEATSGSISIGLNSTAASQDAIAIGNGAGWTGDGYASNMGRYSVAVGTLAGSEGADSAAFGSSAHTFGGGAVAVGNRAKAGTESVSVGRDSSTSNCNSSIAIGLRAATSAQRSIAIGHNARAAVSSLAIGSYTGDAYTEAGNSSIAIGAGAKSCTDSGSSGISIGYLASTPNGGTAIGANASANSSAIAIGTWSAATGSWATAYGYKATARVNGSTSIGAWADASGLGSVAIGGGRGKWGSSPSDTPAAAATATESIQLGVGTNSVANTFQVWGHRMLDKNTGKMPVDRIPDAIARKSEIPSTDAIISALTNSPAFMEAITNSIVFKSAVSNAVADSVAAELEAADSANPRSVAMFSIPINSAGEETRYTGIELKCSTNNFVDVTYFANAFTDEYDGMSMFVQNAGDDKRAYTRVEGTESEIAAAISNATELVVLVSAADCERNDGGWLNANNDDAAWTFARLRVGEREQNPDGSARWRTCAPIRWFRRMPEWAIQSE